MDGNLNIKKIPSIPNWVNGQEIQPTVIDSLQRTEDLSCYEIFGPAAVLLPVEDFSDAFELGNATEHGLTAAIHKRNVDRVM